MEKNPTVSDLPPSERPRERLQKLGAELLSEPELLALILGRGMRGRPVLVLAQDLLRRFGSLQGIADASLEQLMEIPGIKLAKATQLKAVTEVRRRLRASELTPTPQRAIAGAPAAAEIARGHVTDWKVEHFLTIALNARGKFIRCDRISTGSLNSTVVHPREVFRAAIAACAAAVIFVHNHPSGDPEPSDDDIALTKRLVSAGQLMGIPVHDHVIITEHGFTSLRSRNLI